MAKPRILFTDSDGSWTLQSDYPVAVGGRFRGFIPDKMPIGDSDYGLADEALYMFRTSWRYGCHFEVPGLLMAAAAGASSMLDVAHKLKAHLLNGGACEVYMEDALSSHYASCGLYPGTVPDIRQVDRRTLEYALRVSLINRAAAEITCHYVT